MGEKEIVTSSLGLKFGGYSCKSLSECRDRQRVVKLTGCDRRGNSTRPVELKTDRWQVSQAASEEDNTAT